MTIEITDGTAKLCLEVLRYSYPEGDYWDGNWVAVSLRASLPGFQASLGESLHLGELNHFRGDLQRLYEELNGTARFSAMEGFLDLTAEMDALGHLYWKVKLSHPVGGGNEACLHFMMHTDQSFLPPVIAQIEAMIEGFPIRGQITQG